MPFATRFHLAWGLLALLAAAPQVQADRITALDRYIAAPDTNYTYHLVKSIPGKGYNVEILEMTSQSWLTEKEVNRTLWKHWVIITRPDEVAHSTGLLFIGGGKNEPNPPGGPDGNMVKIALATKSVVTELRMVPNQPLIFGGDGHERVEDDLIAYTWDKYLRTGDERWPARLPMTKSAVRAMDTVTSFCAGTEGGQIKVDSFVVAGGSKRGWTTWTTAAVDKRVKAIVPIVINMLNIEPSFRHHWQAYGFWAPAVGNYVEQGIMDWQGTKEYRNLMKIEEPYQYRERFTMPKFIINATGDQFFLPDSSQFYFKDLPGTKYLRYVPNADHSLKNSDALETLLSSYYAVLNRSALPRFTWTTEHDGALRVRAKDAPKTVKLWQATNPNARDFRLETLGPGWTSTDLSDQGGGTFIGRVSKPEKGWTAFMVELTYEPEGFPAPLKFTTQVNVVPDVLPFPPPAIKKHP